MNTFPDNLLATYHRRKTTSEMKTKDLASKPIYTIYLPIDKSLPTYTYHRPSHQNSRKKKERNQLQEKEPTDLFMK